MAISAASAYAAANINALNASETAYALSAPTRAALHGVRGGLTSLAQGGKFGPGFLAGGFGSAAGRINVGNFGGNLIIASVVEGTASVLGGGKFANGAVTGAFSYLAASAAQGARELQLKDGAVYPFALTDKALQGRLASAKGTFRKFLGNSDYAGLLENFDDTTFTYVSDQPVSQGRLVGARAYTMDQTVDVFPAGLLQWYGDVVELIGHEFRHLQPANDRYFTNHNTFRHSWDTHPGERDATAWSRRVICQGKGGSTC